MLLAHTVTDVCVTDLDLARLIPMIISRIIVSLKKAASSRPLTMSLEIPTGLPMSLEDTRSPHTMDTVRLSVFES